MNLQLNKKSNITLHFQGAILKPTVIVDPSAFNRQIRKLYQDQIPKYW